MMKPLLQSAGLGTLLLAGCVMPPDLVKRPEFLPPPAVQKDNDLLATTPVDSEYLNLAAESPGKHRVALLETGEDALLARIHLIRSARKSIDIQTFIYVYDESGCWVFKELLHAARRGVRVRLLVDHIISPGISPEEYAALAAAHVNLEVRLFRPISRDALFDSMDVTQSALTRFSTMNYRMHNKVMMIDDSLAIIGGRNFQNAYYDRDPQLSFRDRDVLVSGPSIPDVKASFDLFWSHRDSIDVLRMDDLRRIAISGQGTFPEGVTSKLPQFFTSLDQSASSPDLSVFNPELKLSQVDRITFITDEPIKTSRLKNPLKKNPFAIIYSLFENAEKEILIQTPYSVIGDKTYKTLRKIRKEKPELRMCMSTNSLASADHFFVGSIALKQRRFQIEGLKLELYLAKPVPGDIREFVPRYDKLLEEAGALQEDEWLINTNLFGSGVKEGRFCVHGKSMVVDRKISFVGSHNFDPRSVHLNSECMVMIEDEPFSSQLAKHIETAIKPQNSWVVAPRNLPPVVNELNSLVSLISSNLPMFDIWILEDVSCFDLKDGSTPLSPYDPDFYQSYIDVGPSPGLDLGLEQVRVQLIRAFGGAAAPLM